MFSGNEPREINNKGQHDANKEKYTICAHTKVRKVN